MHLPGLNGKVHITERLYNRMVDPATHPGIRSLLSEARSVIEGRDDALRFNGAFAALLTVVRHWDEFGPEHGFDEKMDAARKLLSNATSG